MSHGSACGIGIRGRCRWPSKIVVMGTSGDRWGHDEEGAYAQCNSIFPVYICSSTAECTSAGTRSYGQVNTANCSVHRNVGAWMYVETVAYVGLLYIVSHTRLFRTPFFIRSAHPLRNIGSLLDTHNCAPLIWLRHFQARWHAQV